MANVTFNVLKIKGVITWLWLMLCLIEILIADTETGGQLMGEQGRKLSTMTGEMSESTRPIIDLKSYIPSRPRRKHRYINIDEEGKVNEDKIAAIDQGINHLDHSRSVFSVPSIEATTRLQNADMNYDDRREEVQTIFMTTEVSDQPYEATSTFNLYDEGKHEKSPVNELTPENVQTYLYNIHRIVEYYKEAAGTEAAKRAKALEMLSNEQQQLLRVSNENRSWRDHFLKLKESHQRLSKAKTSVDFNLALTVGSMRNLLRSPLVAATSVSNNGTSSDESNSSNSLFLKLFPKGLLASAKINGHHSLDAVYQSTLSDELTESFQLSLQDRDIMIHLLSNELEGMQGKFDLWLV